VPTELAGFLKETRTRPPGSAVTSYARSSWHTRPATGRSARYTRGSARCSRTPASLQIRQPVTRHRHAALLVHGYSRKSRLGFPIGGVVAGLERGADPVEGLAALELGEDPASLSDRALGPLARVAATATEHTLRGRQQARPRPSEQGLPADADRGGGLGCGVGARHGRSVPGPLPTGQEPALMQLAPTRRSVYNKSRNGRKTIERESK
jgi:hypothetical protein